jgi:PAS domain S-box-containing protein
MVYPLFCLLTLDQVIDRSPLVVSSDTTLKDAICIINHSLAGPLDLDPSNQAGFSWLNSFCFLQDILILNGNHPVGLLTPGEVVRLMASDEILLNIAEIRVGDVISSNLITRCQSEVQDVLAAFNLLRQYPPSSLLIEDYQGKWIGIITPHRLNKVMQPLCWNQLLTVQPHQSAPLISEKTAYGWNVPAIAPTSPLHSPTSININGQALTLHLQQRSEHRYYALANLLPMGVFRTDTQGYLVYVNQHWCESSGISLETALLGDWTQILHPDDRDQVLTEWQQMITQQREFKAEYRLLHSDGTLIWVLGQAIPEIDSQGELTGFIGTITEIGDRKQIEGVLHASECKLQAVLAAMTDVILILDQHGQYLNVISTPLDQISHQLDESTHKTIYDLLPSSQADRVLSYIQKTLSTGQTTSFEYSLQLNDIETWFSAKVSLMTADINSLSMNCKQLKSILRSALKNKRLPSDRPIGNYVKKLSNTTRLKWLCGKVRSNFRKW